MSMCTHTLDENETFSLTYNPLVAFVTKIA